MTRNSQSLLLSSAPQAQMHIANSMRNVQEQVKALLKDVAAEDIFMAFDIDMTLIHPLHPAVYYPTVIKYLDHYLAILNTLPHAHREVPNMLAISLPQALLEACTPGIISEFKEYGIKMIAFTASFAGKVGNIPRFEVKRYHDLQALNISFEESFSSHQEIIFTEFEAYQESYPAFYQGILCSNGEAGTTTKGSVLVSFLKEVRATPQVIIMVDDKEKNLEDIAFSLKEHAPHIRFIGIHYQCASDCSMGSIDIESFKQFWQALTDQVLAVNTAE